MRKFSILLPAAAVVVLAGCASQPYSSSYQAPYPSQYQDQNQYQDQYQTPSQYQRQGYIESAVITGMREVSVTGSGNTSGAGAVVGALVGGVLGHQVGKGTGRDLATLGGAVAGGVVGNEMERSSAPKVKTELTLRMPDGEQRTVLVEPGGYYRMGDRVRVTYQNGAWVLVH
ncbi:MAG: glycine zipper 2TM domain-containing protein [Burkholderiales bacterium]|nr:glycine zipper 2TM domain-containing protein [Burkholderiales bacterium]